MLHNDNKDMFDDVCDCGYEDTNDGIEFSDPSHDKDSHSVIMRLAALHTRSGEESSDTLDTALSWEYEDPYTRIFLQLSHEYF